MHLGVSRKSHTLISLRASISVNSDFQSVVLRHSKRGISVPQVLSPYCKKDQNTGEGGVRKSYAELEKAEWHRRYVAIAQDHTAGEWAMLKTKPPYKPHPLEPACCHTLSFLKSVWDIISIILVGLILLCCKWELLLKYQSFVFIRLAKHLFLLLSWPKSAQFFSLIGHLAVMHLNGFLLLYDNWALAQKDL